ncbi:MAG: DUF3089 domain-containing protein [Sphingomonas sp.]|nr:DUF3089 domain-containing protein [Sphingomonas sp.]
MCARRFLSCLFWLTLLFVAGVFAFFQWGSDFVVRQSIPHGHFQPPPAKDGPDYSKAENWLARDDLPDNPSRWAPSNDMSPENGTKDTRVFYVHPTTYLRRDAWNAPIRPEPGIDSGTRLITQSQASAFGKDAQVWAPRYRQAAFGAFLLTSNDAEKALDLAYSDVLAAFDEFLRRNPKGPVILAGHSQGGLHVSRLLRDRQAVLRGRLIAAYVVGWPLSTKADLPAMGLAACASPNQTGCILSWQSFAEPANPGMIMDAWEGTKGPTGMKRDRDDMLCVNPISGTANGIADPASNRGTLIPSSDLRSAMLEPGRVGARCKNGLLIIDGNIPAFSPPPLLGNNFHVYDFALFWGSIRADAERRIQAWHR